MRALLSVANRDGIAALARDLLALDVEVFATDGTREYLAGDGVEVASVSELTEGEPTVGGQVKTFHHAVYAGILARRDVPAQLEELEAQGIGLIDLVVVNVKPFAPAIGVKLIGLDEAIEMIDVGGAALLGAAARNAAGVAAVADPAHYAGSSPRSASSARVSAETAGAASRPRRSARSPPTTPRSPPTSTRSPANTFPRRLAIVLEKVGRPALRREPAPAGGLLPRDDAPQRHARRRDAQLQGELPSFNNLLDLDAAYRIARDYTAPTVAIVKHTDPVGLASHDELVEAYRHALETDPVASFGGIVGGQPRARRRDRPGDRRQLVRGGRRARVQPVRARDPARRSPASSCWPSRRTRPRACATTASPASTSSGSPAACSSRPSTSSGSIAAGSRS